MEQNRIKQAQTELHILHPKSCKLFREQARTRVSYRGICDVEIVVDRQGRSRKLWKLRRMLLVKVPIASKARWLDRKSAMIMKGLISYSTTYQAIRD